MNKEAYVYGDETKGHPVALENRWERHQRVCIFLAISDGVAFF